MIKSKSSFDTLFSQLPANEAWEQTPVGEAKRHGGDIVVRNKRGSTETRYVRHALNDAASGLQQPNAATVAGPVASSAPSLPLPIRLLNQLDATVFENGGRGRLVHQGDPEVGSFVHLGIRHLSMIEGAEDDAELLARCGTDILKHMFLLGQEKNHLTVFVEGAPSTTSQTITPAQVKGAGKIFKNFSFDAPLTARQAEELQDTGRIPFIYAYLAQKSVTIRGTEEPGAVHLNKGKVKAEWFQAHKDRIGKPRDAYLMNGVLKPHFEAHPGDEVVVLFGAGHDFTLSLEGPGALKAQMYSANVSSLSQDELLASRLDFYPSMSGFYESDDD